MKKLMIFLISLSFISVLNAEPVETPEAILIINNSNIDFSQIDNLADYPFVIEEGDFDAMISGQSKLLISDKKWTDEQMADYKQRNGSLPLMLIIAGYSEFKDATAVEQAEVFSTRAGNKLLYFYVSELKSEDAKQAIALHFSETLQPWFNEHDLMPTPNIIQHQNRVELGLIEPIYEGGYK